jgi:hypothetical protein
VEVGNTLVSGSQILILNDETLMVAVPVPTALGSVPVVVHTAAGRSNIGELVYGPNNPPILQSPYSVPVGKPVKWTYGGDVGNMAVLLLSASGETDSAGAHDVLADAVIAHSASLNAAALGRYTLPTAPASLVGMQLFAQVVMFAGGGIDAVSSVRATNVLP